MNKITAVFILIILVLLILSVSLMFVRHMQFSYKMKIIMTAVTVLCVLGWLSFVRIWTIKRPTGDFKISTYDKLRDLDY